ncbi:prepilin-type N-terminal cleavage/methylation domain-containing protein [Candidatus Saccharibacteria bacterium]|nr:prepilin-type N-terminal cleavage/methylation domain-containing protein [Candidatus Saccharibacteria bacterium]
MKKYIKYQTGFTILELMIATTVFSVVLLLCTYGLIEIGRNYYKGAAVARTQNATRAALDDISQSIQYGAADPLFDEGNTVIPGIDRAICIGSKKYVVGATHGITVEQTDNSCSIANLAAIPDKPRQQLLGENMHLTKFSFDVDDSEYTVSMQVVFGDITDSDTFDTASSTCKGGRNGQFCAASQLESTVRRRVKGGS